MNPVPNYMQSSLKFFLHTPCDNSLINPSLISSFSWCEGIINEKNKKDETELTVHFPGTFFERNLLLFLKNWLFEYPQLLCACYYCTESTHPFY